MAKVFEKTKAFGKNEFTYCPGCTHGIIHRLVGEVLEELEVFDKAVTVGSVGCSVYSYKVFECDGIQTAHGRAPAVATGIKRTKPDSIVFTYQGDGDLASIGTAEIIHAAHRSENITVIYVNNAIYGMTGGQLAPTTLVGQKTTTSPYGRDEALNGAPLKMAEVLSQVPGTQYATRVSTHNPAHIRKAKAAIKKAFLNQINNKGFSFVELLGTCNIGYGKTPVESMKWVESDMIPYYPLGTYKEDGQIVKAGE